MAIPVLILGDSGSGKSTSLRNFQPEEVGIINVIGKPLPFKKKLSTVKTDNYMTIEAVLKKAKAKSIVIDDAQYLMSNEYMRNAKVNGFQKFIDLGTNFWTLIRMIPNELPEDVIVYILSHLERDNEGREKMKTIGKMLDEKITVEGMFTIVLKAISHDGGYYFRTHTNGNDTVKSPMGMFDADEIDNDLKMVDEIIRNYYEIGGKEK